MVSDGKEANKNLQSRGLKVKDTDRVRKSRSFMARIGFGGGSSQDEKLNTTSTSINIFDASSQKQTMPSLSSPKLMAVFGHGHGIDAPGQHPSNYPFGIVNALHLAGVPLPGTDSIRKSFDIPSPNEGSSEIAGIPKILLNLSDMPTSFNETGQDLVSSEEKYTFPSKDQGKDHEIVSKESGHSIQPRKVHTSMPNQNQIPLKEAPMLVRPAQRQSSIRHHNLNRFSTSTGSSISSIEFSLSVALMPPDCEIESLHEERESHLENREKDLVSAYAVANVFATALGSPMAISKQSSLLTRGEEIRKATSSAVENATKALVEMKKDMKEKPQLKTSGNRTIFKISEDDFDDHFSESLLHTPSKRFLAPDNRKRHQSFNDNTLSQLNDNIEMTQEDGEKNERECQKNNDKVFRIQTQSNKTSKMKYSEKNAKRFETEGDSICGANKSFKSVNGEKIINNKQKNKIKSVAAVAVEAARALQEENKVDYAENQSLAPSTPKNNSSHFLMKKRFQGSPPPIHEYHQDSIEHSMPETPLQFLSHVKKVHSQTENSHASKVDAEIPLHDENIEQTMAHRMNIGYNTKVYCQADVISNNKVEEDIPNTNKFSQEDDLQQNKQTNRIKQNDLQDGERIFRICEKVRRHMDKDSETEMRQLDLVAEFQSNKILQGNSSLDASFAAQAHKCPKEAVPELLTRSSADFQDFSCKAAQAADVISAVKMPKIRNMAHQKQTNQDFSTIEAYQKTNDLPIVSNLKSDVMLDGDLEHAAKKVQDEDSSVSKNEIQWLFVNNRKDLQNQKVQERRKSMMTNRYSRQRTAEENEKRRSVYAEFGPKFDNTKIETAKDLSTILIMGNFKPSNLINSNTSVNEVSGIKKENKQIVINYSHKAEEEEFDSNGKSEEMQCKEVIEEEFESDCNKLLCMKGEKATMRRKEFLASDCQEAKEHNETRIGLPEHNSIQFASRSLNYAKLVLLNAEGAYLTGSIPVSNAEEVRGQKNGTNEVHIEDLNVKPLFVCSGKEKNLFEKESFSITADAVLYRGNNTSVENKCKFSRSARPEDDYRNNQQKNELGLKCIKFSKNPVNLRSIKSGENFNNHDDSDFEDSYLVHKEKKINKKVSQQKQTNKLFEEINENVKAPNEFNVDAKTSSPEFLFSKREEIQQWTKSFDNVVVDNAREKAIILQSQHEFKKENRLDMHYSGDCLENCANMPFEHRCKFKEGEKQQTLNRSKSGTSFNGGLYKYDRDSFERNQDNTCSTQRPFDLIPSHQHHHHSRRRSQSLTSFHQTDFDSLLSTSSSTVSITKAYAPLSTVNRQSVSSIAPTLVTALASLPSDRSIEQLTNNFHIPGSFEHNNKMSSLRRSRSLHSLIAKRRSQSVNSSESSAPASEAFKSAFSGDYVEQQQEQSSSSRIASRTYEDDSSVEDNTTISPRSSMMQTQKAQLRASHLLGNNASPSFMTQADSSDSRQESLFDQFDNDNEEEKQFRETHGFHRRCSSDITTNTALMRGLGLHQNQTISRPQKLNRRSTQTSKSSETFLSDMGCWMEEAEEEREREMIVDGSNSVSSLNIRKSKTNAPPVPPRRRPETRRAPNSQDSMNSILTSTSKPSVPAASASAGSWSRVRKVPMYIRLGHLPNRLVDAPSTMSWRSRIGQEQYEELSQKFDQREMHRQEVIEELYVTEHNFIVQVTSILRTFSEPLRFSDHAFHDSVPLEVARLFQDLDTILAVHIKMFTAMDANIKAHPSSLVVSLADSIRPTIEGLAAYQSYLNRYKSVIRLLDSLTLTGEKGSLAWFAETMERQSGLSECKGMSFASFLLKPVQRLMKYPLFFKQLDELMDESHPDKDSTTTLYRATERLIGNLNAVKAREEDYEMLLSLEQRISGLPEGTFLACRQRKLIKQGSIQCVRLTEMERLTLSERSRWESPNLNYQSPLLSSFDGSANSSLRRLSLIGSSPTNSPRNLEPEPGLESGSTSGCSTSSNSASTPSAGSNLTISSTLTSPALSSTYFDFKSADESKDYREFGDQKRKSYAGFLLRGGNATQTSPVPMSFDGSMSKSASRSEMKEEDELYVFIFDDLCLITKRDSRPLKSKKKKTNATTKEDLDTFTALEFVGMSRILAVQQWKNALIGHTDLLEVEIMPIKSESAFKNNSLSSTISFHFSFDSAKDQSSLWNQAFERSFCASIQTRKEQVTKGIDFNRKVAAQMEWRKREKHITEVVNNAALAADRVNLSALLQAGLPFPRSPAQQNLADIAFRTAAKVESCGLDVGKSKDSSSERQRVSSVGQFISTSPTSSIPSRPTMTRLRSTNSNPSLRSAANANRQFDVESVPRIGDMNAMYGGSGTGTITSWEEDRQEERKWWRMRFHEVEEENVRQEEVEKMVEMRRSRISIPSPKFLSLNSSCLESTGIPMMRLNSSQSTFPAVTTMDDQTTFKSKSQFDLFNSSSTRMASTPSPARTVRSSKVRKGLPILKISSANESIRA